MHLNAIWWELLNSGYVDDILIVEKQNKALKNKLPLVIRHPGGGGGFLGLSRKFAGLFTSWTSKFGPVPPF